MSDFSLSQLIRDALDRSPEPDPHVIARRLLPRIPDEERQMVLAQCLADRVREQIRFDRMHVTREPESASAPRAGGRSRWSRLPVELRQRYAVAGEWKVLADCVAEDCEAIAADYKRRAEEQAALEQRFLKLAAQMREVGAVTVADLYAIDLGVAA